jgi:hypothetical protein
MGSPSLSCRSKLEVYFEMKNRISEIWLRRDKISDDISRLTQRARGFRQAMYNLPKADLDDSKMHYIGGLPLFGTRAVSSISRQGESRSESESSSGGEFKTSFGPATVVLYRLRLDLQKKDEETVWKPRVRVGGVRSL